MNTGTLAQMQRSPRDLARWEEAQKLLLSGEPNRATALYRALVSRYTQIPELWFEFGNASAGVLDFAQTDQAYQNAMRLAAGNASLLVSIGQQYQGLRKLDQARAAFECAVASEPASVDARISLAAWFEKQRRLAEAWECVQACLAQHPRDDQARYFHAFLLHRQGRNTDAESALRDLLRAEPQYPYVKYASRHLLAVVLDQLGQYGQALRWLQESKDQLRLIIDTTALERGYDEGERTRRELLARFTPEQFRRWCASLPEAGSARRVAFLGGHPRSGTTLIEQVLDAHPQVLAFDEPEAFTREIAGRLVAPRTSPSAALQSLNSLPERRRQELRQCYLKSLLREVDGEEGGRVLLDKNPSPTAMLHFWLRVFPELRVIIALRDPRDVVLSCYFLNIMLNVTNVNFLKLERAAKHYADLMDVWLRLREFGGFNWVEVRYEDVVTSLEKEGRRVTEFLGLIWAPAQARYYETARQKFLFAPTYHDVTQPVYTHAVGRWQRYAEALAPVQERLAPYCRAFGYSA
ncbi:MAG TPA: sulfotransferase [Verrucomicrobiae bacterium]|nr:sulfotransferase [Verrucomicrobiae bacterium]